MPRTVLKVWGRWVGGGGGVWGLRAILVLSLSLDQAEQNLVRSNLIIWKNSIGHMF